MGKKILKKIEEGKKGSGFAIASLVLGILSVLLGWLPFVGWILVILALVFGILALIKIKKGTASGKNMAIAGLVLGGIGLLFAIMMGAFVFTSDKSNVCGDIDCFIAKANQCEPAVYEETTDMGKIMYYTETDDAGNCVLRKVITELSKNEDPIIKKVLEDKGMECTYTKGNFNNQWMTSMVKGLEDCQGELKDALGPLLLLTV